MRTITISISGMHCVSCAMNIDGELEDTQGVKEATTSYSAGEVSVQFDETQVGEEALCAVIRKLGYVPEVKK